MTLSANWPRGVKGRIQEDRPFGRTSFRDYLWWEGDPGKSPRKGKFTSKNRTWVSSGRKNRKSGWFGDLLKWRVVLEPIVRGRHSLRLNRPDEAPVPWAGIIRRYTRVTSPGIPGVWRERPKRVRASEVGDTGRYDKKMGLCESRGRGGHL